jgi:hypothetical protein
MSTGVSNDSLQPCSNGVSRRFSRRRAASLASYRSASVENCEGWMESRVLIVSEKDDMLKKTAIDHELVYRIMDFTNDNETDSGEYL